MIDFSAPYGEVQVAIASSAAQPVKAFGDLTGKRVGVIGTGSTAIQAVPQIAAQAKRDGVSDLRESGLRKVRQGLTSIEEVLGVTNE